MRPHRRIFVVQDDADTTSLFAAASAGSLPRPGGASMSFIPLTPVSMSPPPPGADQELRQRNQQQPLPHRLSPAPAVAVSSPLKCGVALGRSAGVVSSTLQPAIVPVASSLAGVSLEIDGRILAYDNGVDVSVFRSDEEMASTYDAITAIQRALKAELRRRGQRMSGRCCTTADAFTQPSPFPHGPAGTARRAGAATAKSNNPATKRTNKKAKRGNSKSSRNFGCKHRGGWQRSQREEHEERGQPLRTEEDEDDEDEEHEEMTEDVAATNSKAVLPVCAAQPVLVEPPCWTRVSAVSPARGGAGANTAPVLCRRGVDVSLFDDDDDTSEDGDRVSSSSSSSSSSSEDDAASSSSSSSGSPETESTVSSNGRRRRRAKSARKRCLTGRSVEGGADAVSSLVRPCSSASLVALSVAVLRSLLRVEGLSATGSKAQLVDRLVQLDASRGDGTAVHTAAPVPPLSVPSNESPCDAVPWPTAASASRVSAPPRPSTFDPDSTFDPEARASVNIPCSVMQVNGNLSQCASTAAGGAIEGELSDPTLSVATGRTWATPTNRQVPGENGGVFLGQSSEDKRSLFGVGSACGKKDSEARGGVRQSDSVHELWRPVANGISGEDSASHVRSASASLPLAQRPSTNARSEVPAPPASTGGKPSVAREATSPVAWVSSLLRRASPDHNALPAAGATAGMLAASPMEGQADVGQSPALVPPPRVPEKELTTPPASAPRRLASLLRFW